MITGLNVNSLYPGVTRRAITSRHYFVSLPFLRIILAAHVVSISRRIGVTI